MILALLTMLIVLCTPAYAQQRGGFSGFSAGSPDGAAFNSGSANRQSAWPSAEPSRRHRSWPSDGHDHHRRYQQPVTLDRNAFVPSPNRGGRHWGPVIPKHPPFHTPRHRHHVPSVVIIEVPQTATIVQPTAPYQQYQPAPYVEPQGLTPVPSSYPEAGIRSPQQVAPFDATPQEVVARIVKLADVKKGDVLYDLGSGDGRIVITAAKKYGIKAVGFEVDTELVRRARESARKQGVAHLVEFREQDFLTADLSPATVVTLYLSSDGNLKLRPQLLKQLKAGARVVSYTFDMGDWQPKIAEAYWDGAGNAHQLYLWEIGAQLRFSDARR